MGEHPQTQTKSAPVEYGEQGDRLPDQHASLMKALGAFGSVHHPRTVLSIES